MGSPLSSFSVGRIGASLTLAFLLFLLAGGSAASVAVLLSVASLTMLLAARAVFLSLRASDVAAVAPTARGDVDHGTPSDRNAYLDSPHSPPAPFHGYLLLAP